MYITSPAVIKQINSLEGSLNLRLFERTHRGLFVTAAGKSLYRDAKYLIQYSKDSIGRAKDAMDIQEEVIRIGVSPMTPPQVLVTLWPKIQKYCPELKLKLIPFENTPENAREILGNLEQNIEMKYKKKYKRDITCRLTLHNKTGLLKRFRFIYNQNQKE